DVLGRVDERLALGDTGAGRGEIDGIGTKTLGSQAETGPRPGGRFEEEVDDDFAFEGRHFLATALADLDESFGRIEDGLDLQRAEVFQAEQVPAGPLPRPSLTGGEFEGHEEFSG